jgi:hypothetical protein
LKAYNLPFEEVSALAKWTVAGSRSFSRGSVLATFSKAMRETWIQVSRRPKHHVRSSISGQRFKNFRFDCRRAAALWEGTRWWCKGGTGKAEAAKLPDAGISLKQCPEKMSARKTLT